MLVVTALMYTIGNQSRSMLADATVSYPSRKGCVEGQSVEGCWWSTALACTRQERVL